LSILTGEFVIAFLCIFAVSYEGDKISDRIATRFLIWDSKLLVRCRSKTKVVWQDSNCWISGCKCYKVEYLDDGRFI